MCGQHVNNASLALCRLLSASVFVLTAFMEYSFLIGCASQFWHITSGVCRAVTACLGGGGRPATLSQELVMACYHRVNRAQNQLLALMERIRTGRHRGGWRRVTPVLAEHGLRQTALPEASKRTAIVLPRRFGWLVQLVGYQAAGHGSQLAHLLSDPEMVALVRDLPQARRILAPLCRMLGVDCEGLCKVPGVRSPARPRVGLADVGASVPVAEIVGRVGYVPSAKWPRGVITRASIRLKPV